MGLPTRVGSKQGSRGSADLRYKASMGLPTRVGSKCYDQAVHDAREWQLQWGCQPESAVSSTIGIWQSDRNSASMGLPTRVGSKPTL